MGEERTCKAKFPSTETTTWRDRGWELELHLPFQACWPRRALVFFKKVFLKEMVFPPPPHSARSLTFYTKGIFIATYLITRITSLFQCADVDECQSPETNQCDRNALCTNTEGFYVCRCLKGYTGDGQICTGKKMRKKPLSVRRNSSC